MDKKGRIVKFIESLEKDSTTASKDISVFSIGAGTNNTDNNGDCRNAGNCDYSSNGGSCTNQSSCSYSTNGGACKNPESTKPILPGKNDNCLSGIKVC